MNTVQVIQADLDDPRHRAAVLAMTRAYARDPMGNGRDLDEVVQQSLVEALRAHPTTLVFLAFDGDEPIGITTCFIGFSTFAARPLLNIHDVYVAGDYRGTGVAWLLLEAVEKEARARDCCKLTLEVQEKNLRARALYERFGFSHGQYEPDAGVTLFRQKALK